MLGYKNKVIRLLLLCFNKILNLYSLIIFFYQIGELISHMAIHAHGKPGGGLGDPTEFQYTPPPLNLHTHLKKRRNGKLKR